MSESTPLIAPYRTPKVRYVLSVAFRSLVLALLVGSVAFHVMYQLMNLFVVTPKGIMPRTYRLWVFYREGTGYNEEYNGKTVTYCRALAITALPFGVAALALSAASVGIAVVDEKERRADDARRESILETHRQVAVGSGPRAAAGSHEDGQPDHRGPLSAPHINADAQAGSGVRASEDGYADVDVGDVDRPLYFYDRESFRRLRDREVSIALECTLCLFTAVTAGALAALIVLIRERSPSYPFILGESASLEIGMKLYIAALAMSLVALVVAPISPLSGFELCCCALRGPVRCDVTVHLLDRAGVEAVYGHLPLEGGTGSRGTSVAVDASPMH